MNEFKYHYLEKGIHKVSEKEKEKKKKYHYEQREYPLSFIAILLFQLLSPLSSLVENRISIRDIWKKFNRLFTHEYLQWIFQDTSLRSLFLVKKLHKIVLIKFLDICYILILFKNKTNIVTGICIS